ncbi:PspC domain-containing protein [Pedobacter sp. MC2016-14]|uniref:PspC domain-containing protein n=1 Tax=Pedobacter sp. MC2016-14 TaxID=2897327 RepID=UPI001E2B5D15|nr:PspC domain-containing protein [Pedobacter sp. MC2016-14]MCD0488353.1 PspC domain-containing protein [Pedobacter sp. MC2016-14]
MDRRLLRNVHDKIIAGVSSGIGEYMEVDVTIIRLLFVLSTIFLFGTGALVYLIMWIIVPVNNDPAARFSKFGDFFKDPVQPMGDFADPKTYTVEDAAEKATPNWSSATFGKEKFTAGKPEDPLKPFPKDTETGRTVGGLFLLVIGVYFLLNEFNIIPFWFSLSKLWPLVFVAIGISFILKSKRKNNWEDWKNQQDHNFRQNDAGDAKSSNDNP